MLNACIIQMPSAKMKECWIKKTFYSFKLIAFFLKLDEKRFIMTFILIILLEVLIFVEDEGKHFADVAVVFCGVLFAVMQTSVKLSSDAHNRAAKFQKFIYSFFVLSKCQMFS